MKATHKPPHARSGAARTLRLRAPAKLNLTLRVLARREDGYHEIQTFMVAVDLCDDIEITERPGTPFQVACDHPEVPNDDRNLVHRAAREFATLAEGRGGSATLEGFQVRIQKRIPPGAGLGGGSSDAAATLRALNGLFSAGCDLEQLAACGARVGSDVPFFLHGPAAIAGGRGEQVTPVPVQWPGRFVVICPPLDCQTARVYANCRPRPPGTRQPVNPFADGAKPSAAQLAQRLFNDLEEAAFLAYPRLAEWSRQLQRICPLPVRLTGSGSAFFCPMDTEKAATQLADLVNQRLGFATYVTQLLSDMNTEGAAS